MNTATTPTPLDAVKARRITGGAIVTITRADGRVHRYRVGLRRYNRLYDTLSTHRGLSGYFGRGGCVCHIRDIRGLAESRRRARQWGCRAKHWASN